MTDLRKSWLRGARLVLLVSAAALTLAACNLGPQAPSEPVDANAIGTLQPQNDGVGGVSPAITETPILQVPPTDIPVIPLASEQLGPITVDGTGHRSLEPITIRVQRGKSVSGMTCSWVLRDTNQTAALGTPATAEKTLDTFEDVFTFTPQAAGTYSISCTATALTAAGQAPVQAASGDFSVEAKG